MKTTGTFTISGNIGREYISTETLQSKPPLNVCITIKKSDYDPKVESACKTIAIVGNCYSSV